MTDPITPSWNEHRVMVFAGQFDTHIRTGEDYQTRTLGDLFTLAPGSRAKGAGLAFIPSTYSDYDGREHMAQRQRGAFVALTADIDEGNHTLARVEELVRPFVNGAAWLIYSSAHARPGDMRWRIIMPLSRPVDFATWHDAQNALFNYLVANGVAVDRSLERAAQPVYLPNVPQTHAKMGTPLRGSDGQPLYYRRASTGASSPGLRCRGLLKAGMVAIVRKREADERERERIRAEALRRRATRPHNDGGSLIDAFNASTSVRDLLDLYGYQQCPRGGDDYRSPMQTGMTFATRVFDDHWVSLSGSDTAAGLGRPCATGCSGDAFDLFVHFEHDGDHRAAFRQLGRQRRASAGMRAA